MSKDADIPTLTCLIAFETSVRLGSMTAAAKELGVTQPLVSQRVRALEDAVGGVLIDRSTKPIVPTPAGRKFYMQMRDSLNGVLNAIQVAKRDVKSSKTTISISAYFGFTFYWLMPRLSKLQQEFPDYQFEIKPTNIENEIYSSNSDIRFHFFSDIGKYRYEKLVIPQTVFPLCSPALADELNLKEGDLLSDIEHLPLLHKDFDDPRWINWQAWADILGIKSSGINKNFCYNNYPLLLEATVAGKGLCLGWQGLVEPLVEDKKLIVLGPRISSPTRGYTICSDYAQTLAVKRVIDWFLEEIAAMNIGN